MKKDAAHLGFSGTYIYANLVLGVISDQPVLHQMETRSTNGDPCKFKQCTI